MTRYAVIIERGPTSFGAYVPDLAGCVAVGETLSEVERLIREDGLPVPPATSRAEYVEAPA